MEQRHKYEYEVDMNDESHVATKVLRMVGSDRRVLEIGPGPGSITRLLNGCAATAVEIDVVVPYLEPYI